MFRFVALALLALSTLWWGQVAHGRGPLVSFLSDLRPIENRNVHGGLGIDKPYWTSALILAGTPYEKGLVSHPPVGGTAFVGYGLDRRYRRFKAVLGLASPGPCARMAGSVRYTVRGDGRVLYSTTVRGFDATRHLDLDVSHVRTLVLTVDNLDGTNYCDNAAWAAATVLAR